jgi:chromosome segregation ATPase
MELLSWDRIISFIAGTGALLFTLWKFRHQSKRENSLDRIEEKKESINEFNSVIQSYKSLYEGIRMELDDHLKEKREMREELNHLIKLEQECKESLSQLKSQNLQIKEQYEQIKILLQNKK